MTGKTGTLGQDLLARLQLFPQYEILATDRTTLDLTETSEAIEAVLNQLQPDVIINTAAFSQVDDAEAHYETALKVNRDGPKALAKWTHQHQKYMIHISTDYVFDGQKGAPYEPEDLAHPINRYGQSKYEGETAVLNTLEENGLVVRTSWLFGTQAKNFVPFLIQAALSQSPVRVVTDQWGVPTWTGNLCKMLIEALETRPSGILHGCSTGRTTRYEQAQFICQCLDRPTDFITPVTTDSFQFVAKRPVDTTMKSSFASALTWQEATEKFLYTEGRIKSHV